ncbi:SRPBCC family protein [Halopenitus persicus]|uniref:SRPBCC family protein n=1 Tax=Halopenitus persicus TaxID=1048396 RepID=UPI000BBB58E7|nr:SRPBCC family protein [Halopenitus persicus]
MDELVVRTTVYAEPAAVYDLLADFTAYPRYAEYLDRVDRIDDAGGAAGDGGGDDVAGGDGTGSNSGSGTRYALTFRWWKLTHTVRSEVTAVDPPSRIEWAIRTDIDAHGHWLIEPVAGAAASDSADDADETVGTADAPACEIEFRVRFDPESARAGAIDLPRFVSFDWVLRTATPLIREEAARTVERAVAELEGEPRSVDLEVSVDSDRL